MPRWRHRPGRCYLQRGPARIKQGVGLRACTRPQTGAAEIALRGGFSCTHSSRASGHCVSCTRPFPSFVAAAVAKFIPGSITSRRGNLFYCNHIRQTFYALPTHLIGGQQDNAGRQNVDFMCAGQAHEWTGWAICRSAIAPVWLFATSFGHGGGGGRGRRIFCSGRLSASLGRAGLAVACPNGRQPGRDAHDSQEQQHMPASFSCFLPSSIAPYMGTASNSGRHARPITACTVAAGEPEFQFQLRGPARLEPAPAPTLLHVGPPRRSLTSLSSVVASHRTATHADGWKNGQRPAARADHLHPR